MNLANIIEDHPADAVAIISGDEPTTYGELREQVAGLRGGFAGLGLEPGDRVGIVCANNRYFVVAFLAALGRGLAVVPLNPLSPTPELARELAEVGARAVVVGPAGRASVAAIDPALLPALEHSVSCEGDVPSGSVGLDDLTGSDPAPIVDRDEVDLAVLLFTSGTAGAPKAAMLSHGNLMANIEQVEANPARSRSADDIVFGLLPLFHIFGLNVVLAGTLHTGGSVVLFDRFDPSGALEAIERHGITQMTGPPPMWRALAELPDASPDSVATVRRASSGASKLPDEVSEAVRERFGLVLVEGYGLTETSPVVSTGTGLDPPLGSIGKPITGVDVRLVDSDGTDVLVGDPGEVWVRGPNVFQGYWNNAEATRAVFSGEWFRTGDMALVDEAGFLFLVDRAKDLIIVSGFNVYPAEVEEVLEEHPSVAAAGVVGVDDPVTGEAVRASVVVTPGESTDQGALVAHCEAHLAHYKCPTEVAFVDDLPRGLGGKLLRRALE